MLAGAENLYTFEQIATALGQSSGEQVVYEQLPEATKAASRFVIGPWIHSMESSGDLSYPESDVLGTFMIKQVTEWFEHQLKGQPYPSATRRRASTTSLISVRMLFGGLDFQ